MFIFVKLFSRISPRFLASICSGVCAIKYCSSSTDEISVSTSHMLYILRGEALSRAEPPAGPLKFKMLQFSHNGSEIPNQSGDFEKVWISSSERTILERERHDLQPWPRSFSARKIFPDLSLTGSQTTCNYLHFDSFSAKSVDRIARYHHFCEIIFGK